MSSFNLSQNQKWQYNVRERDQHEACEIWQRGFEREYVEAKTCRRSRRGSSHLSVLRESSRGRELRWALPASRHRVGVGAGPRRAEEGYLGPCWIEIRRRFLRSLSLSLSSASTTSTATWKCELKNKKKKREWDEAEGEGEFGLNRVRLGFGLETSRSLGFLRFWSFEHSTQFLFLLLLLRWYGPRLCQCGKYWFRSEPENLAEPKQKIRHGCEWIIK